MVERLVSISDALGSQFLQTVVQVCGVGISVTAVAHAGLGFVMNFVPSDDIFSARRHRPAHGENKTSFKRDLQQFKNLRIKPTVRGRLKAASGIRIVSMTYFAAFFSVGKIAHARESYGIVRPAWVGMLTALYSRLQAAYTRGT